MLSVKCRLDDMIMTEDSINEKLLEKLRTYSSYVHESPEIFRAVAARLHSRAASHDKQIRDRTLFQLRKKKDNSLQLLLTLIENVDDQISTASIAGIIRECISPKTGIARFNVLRQLIDLNASQSLIKLLIHQRACNVHFTDAFLHEIIWILGQLSQKDPKFAGKVRQFNALPIFHFYLKMLNDQNSKLVIPLLMVIKAVSKNSYLLPILIKDGIAVTMEKIFLGISITPTNKLKLLLNIFTCLSKSSYFCNRLVKAGIVTILLKIFSRWEKYDGKNRLKICGDTIVTLHHICGTKPGRSTIRKENGFTPLYKFCLSCPEDKQYDRLLGKVCSVINVCLQKKELPICSVQGPAHFPLQTDIKKDRDDCPDSDDSDEEDEGDSDKATDDDENDGDDCEVNSNYDPKRSPYYHGIRPTTPFYREIADLQMYRHFFQEYYFLMYNGTLQHTIGEKHESKTNDCAMKTEFENSELETDLKTVQYAKGGTTIPQEYRSRRQQVTGYVMLDFRMELPTRDEQKPVTASSYHTQNSILNNFRQVSEFFLIIHDSCIHILNNISSVMTQRSIYCKIASQVRSVSPFVKVAYPDMMGGDGIGILQPFYMKDRKILRNEQTFFASFDVLNAHNSFQHRNLKRAFQKRSKLIAGVDRNLTERIYNNVVFDLDKLLCSNINNNNNIPIKKLVNNDETRVGIKEFSTSTLVFESRFESGNLRKAIQVGAREYDLILSPDVNSSHHCQWFYFEVSNMDSLGTYTLNIINCEKTNSQFNYGMKPLLYSVREATLGRAGWIRCSTDICYYRNSYRVPSNKNTFLTTSFTVKFPHSLDICYIAYTFPYTYSQLLHKLKNWSSIAENEDIYFRADSLCTSLNGNQVPVITITAPDSKDNRLAEREIAFLSSRVHPGEANSSWVIDGSVSYILSSSATAEKLRNQYVFKIVPMLNVEGVINGCHRCGLTDEDLNRKWSHPDPVLHPSIYHTKGLLEYCTRILKKVPYIYCDFHGHSRRKNAFFFGCSNQESWLEADRNIPNVGIEHLLLPHLMENCSPAFSAELCNYRVERNRESTARVTVWREFGVRRSYTLETSYCGCDQGPYKGFHFDTIHLQEIGANFCMALTCLYEDSKWRMEMLLAKQEGNKIKAIAGAEVTRPSNPTSLESAEDSDQSEENFTWSINQ